MLTFTQPLCSAGRERRKEATIRFQFRLALMGLVDEGDRPGRRDGK
jgi:hypothetical protein